MDSSCNNHSIPPMSLTHPTREGTVPTQRQESRRKLEKGSGETHKTGTGPYLLLLPHFPQHSTGAQ